LRRRGIAYERCGKLIVALGPAEIPALDELGRRGAANGVPGIRRVDAAGLREIEPHAAGIAALHSPETAIVDFAAVAAALADDIRSAGGEILTSAGVTGIVVRSRAIMLRHERGEAVAGTAVFCGGAWSEV
jgi:2-hydroxyglutarate dehydrogenase